MAYCSNCGKELPPLARYCPDCGSYQGKFSPFPEEEEFSAYVGPRAPYYLSQFRKFLARGGGFAFTWNWSAFFFGPIWMLYRRMFLWAVIAFLLEWIPGMNLMIWIAIGCTANYLYFRHVQGKIADFKATSRSHPELLTALRMNSGVSLGSAVLGFILWLMVLFGILCTTVFQELLTT